MTLYRNREETAGISVMHKVTYEDEWLAEAYMKTDYTQLSDAHFQKTINNYCGYLVRSGMFPCLVVNRCESCKLDIVNWKEFRVGDLFEIHPTKPIIDVSADDCGENGVPLVVNSAENNGVVGLINMPPTEQGRIITFSDTTDGNTFFYQPNPFIGFAHVQGMYSKIRVWSKEKSLFLVTILMFEANGRYNYGRKMRRDIISEVRVKLPVDSEGNPDWQYMENYIKSLPYGNRI